MRLRAAAVLVCFGLAAPFGAAGAEPLLVVAEAEATGAPLEVVVRGVEPGQGEVRAALYTSEETFLSEAAQRLVMPVGADGEVRASFGPLAPGAYAVAVIYDRNGNGKLDTDFLGIPREPFGFSNDARASFGPPRFADASVVHDGESQVIEIELDAARARREAHPGS